MPDSFTLNPRPRALCADLPEEEKEWFFAEGRKEITLINKAKRICDSGCPIKQECLDGVLSWESPGLRFGVFGGMSASAREREFKPENRDDRMCRRGLHPMAVFATDPDGRGLVRCSACKAEWERNRRAEAKELMSA